MKNILVVDDESAMRGVLERYLVQSGYRVTAASGGREAIQKATETSFDLILTDLVMPGLGGLDVVAAARDLRCAPEVVVISGAATIDVAVESIKQGAADFLCKPFRLEDVGRVVAAALDRREQRPPSDSLAGEERARSEFLDIVSHELRTPLTAIVGYTALLLDSAFGELGGEQRQALQKIGRSAEGLARVIANILDLSSINAGLMRRTEETFSVSELLLEIVGLTQRSAQAKGLTLSASAPAGLRVRTDRTKLKKALLQLVDNGIKFTQEGAVTLKAGPAASEGLLQIAVQDTGIGIRGEDFPRLFREFQQLEPAATRRTGGTGVGLALSRRLVEFLGGGLHVRSAPQRGSTFIVSLPMEGAPEDAQDLGAAS